MGSCTSSNTSVVPLVAATPPVAKRTTPPTGTLRPLSPAPVSDGTTTRQSSFTTITRGPYTQKSPKTLQHVTAFVVSPAWSSPAPREFTPVRGARASNQERDETRDNELSHVASHALVVPPGLSECRSHVTQRGTLGAPQSRTTSHVLAVGLPVRSSVAQGLAPASISSNIPMHPQPPALSILQASSSCDGRQLRPAVHRFKSSTSTSGAGPGGQSSGMMSLTLSTTTVCRSDELTPGSGRMTIGSAPAQVEAPPKDSVPAPSAADSACPPRPSEVECVDPLLPAYHVLKCMPRRSYGSRPLPLYATAAAPKQSNESVSISSSAQQNRRRQQKRGTSRQHMSRFHLRSGTLKVAANHAPPISWVEEYTYAEQCKAFAKQPGDSKTPFFTCPTCMRTFKNRADRKHHFWCFSPQDAATLRRAFQEEAKHWGRTLSEPRKLASSLQQPEKQDNSLSDQGSSRVPCGPSD